MALAVVVDAHKRSHTLVAVNPLGRKLAQLTVATTSEGHSDALRWARLRFGRDVVWGVEDCRTLTARLERDLLAAGQKVIRVPPHLMSRSRASSRELGKSDPIDALAAARAVLREPDLPVACHDACSMELRLLVDRREDLVQHRVALISRMLERIHQLDPAWAEPRNWENRKPREELGAWLATQHGLLAELARDEFAEIVRLIDAAQALEGRIAGRVREAAPALLGIQGCGNLTAAKIVAEVAGIDRFKSEAAFARHTGVAPIPHWSGETTRPLRPIRHGNRQLNVALHRIATVQITHPGPGRDYFQRRIDEGDSRQRALRSLKRRLARVVYTRMKADNRDRGHGSHFPTLPRVMMLPLADLDPAGQPPPGRARVGRSRALDSYQAALARRMRSYGEKPAYIAAQLGVSVSTVKRALARDKDG
ncbi:IS110 family transposase [Mycolicibacterium chlorophenolicum]|uniref:IS110 family transposase n=1 Tax=Mycolicibacterium chlorophenolicum TaxID=37916 RepID=UPI00103A6466|nr:IS110 family transposase [Mycolicibacterium chlorophenolicum]